MVPRIIVPKGLYRLARVGAAKKGQWYVGPKCKGCGVPIHTIEDSHQGKLGTRLIGEGVFSIPCPRCFTDEVYAIGEILNFQAQEDWEPKTPKRVKPSGKTRRTLMESYPTIKPTFGPGFLEDRPQAAALVGRCIALWTEVEASLAGLLSQLLGADTGPAAAMFITIRSSRTQSEALMAAAKVALANNDYELLEAIMSIKDTAERQRNNLAHGHFGGAYAMETAVAWINIDDYIQHHAQAHKYASPDEGLNWLRSKTFVYEMSDLETIAQQIEHIHHRINLFSGYLSIPSDEPWRAERYRQLCQEPRTHEVLSQLRANRQNEQSRRRKQSESRRKRGK